MWPANVKTDPATGNECDGDVRTCRRTDETSSKGDPWPEITSDADERVPEEAGYGYGV